MEHDLPIHNHIHTLMHQPQEQNDSLLCGVHALPIVSLCCYEGCQLSSGMCTHPECTRLHEHQDQICYMPLKSAKNKIKAKKLKLIEERREVYQRFQNYCNTIRQAFKSRVDRFLSNVRREIGLDHSPQKEEVCQLLLQDRLREISASKVKQLKQWLKGQNQSTSFTVKQQMISRLEKRLPQCLSRLIQSKEVQTLFSLRVRQEQRGETGKKECIAASPSASVLITKDSSLIQFLQLELGLKIQSYYLLYRASQHGFTRATFLEKCGGHSDTLLLILDEEDTLLGGYARPPWPKEEKDCFVDDQERKSFIFNFSNNKAVYQVSQQYSDMALVSKKGFGPCFGDCLQLKEGEGCSSGNVLYEGTSYRINLRKPTKGAHIRSRKHFGLKEYQVYKLSFSSP